MAMKDILSKDFLGYTCVEEKDLDLASAVPLPDSLGFMIGILCIFTIVKLFKNMDDMENIR